MSSCQQIDAESTEGQLVQGAQDRIATGTSSRASVVAETRAGARRHTVAIVTSKLATRKINGYPVL